MSPGFRRSIFGAVVLLFVGLLTGCQTTARTLSVRVQAPDKDVLVCLVEIDRPLAPEEYLEWTRTDLATQGEDLENPFFPQPVYELFYSFHLKKTLLATVHYRRPAGGHPDPVDLEHVRTRDYGPPLP